MGFGPKSSVFLLSRIANVHEASECRDVEVGQDNLVSLSVLKEGKHERADGCYDSFVTLNSPQVLPGQEGEINKTPLKRKIISRAELLYWSILRSCPNTRQSEELSLS